MERGAKRPDGQVEFIKVGGGSHHMLGKIIKPNQRFWAYPSDIPEGMEDLFDLVDPKKTKAEVRAAENTIKTVYKLVAAIPPGKYNIVGPGDKVLNEEPLTKTKADQFIKDLDKK